MEAISGFRRGWLQLEDQLDRDHDVDDAAPLGEGGGHDPVKLEVDEVPDAVQEPAGRHQVPAEAGVSGFVPKITPAARLAEISRDIAAGRRYVDPDIAASALTEDDRPLTDRELRVLRAARTGPRSARSPPRSTWDRGRNDRPGNAGSHRT